MSGRIILIALYKKYHGNWDGIYNAILNKEMLDEEYINAVSKRANRYITILDDNYPERLKHVYKPPFVIKKKNIKEKE